MIIDSAKNNESEETSNNLIDNSNNTNIVVDYDINLSNNTNDQCDMTSLEILNKCHLDLFPKKSPVCDDDGYMKFVSKLPMLSGEYVQFIGSSGKLNNDPFIITNFRLFFLSHDLNSFINVPLMLVESIEVKEIVYIYIYLKVAKTIRLTFNSNEKTLLWANRLNSILNHASKLEELFAFAFYSWHTNENTDEVSDPNRYLFSKSDQTNLVVKEFKRMKFDQTRLWRISEVNKKFDVCSTYPEYVIVPKSISDEQLKKISAFRSSKRFPSVVWRSKKNGAVIARSSQPNVGLWARRLNEDELLLRAIADAANSDASCSSSSTMSSLSCCSSSSNTVTTSTSTTAAATATTVATTATTTSSTAANNNSSISTNPCEPSSLLLIIDARFSSVALANRMKGGGYEYSEYYTNCEIQFMNLENIHVIRSSFQSLRVLCQLSNDNRTVLSQLENTKWLHHISGIIKAAYTVTSAIDQCGKPVLIHCSDGWDRTPQILALAKLLLDPYYRTINGFRTLVEIDWLMFGHKFAQRNGHAPNHNDFNERCPVFLQWLDCVYQITRQFPSAFQFNEIFLLKLCYHSYSCLFGTFLCDSAVERVNEHTDERTFSIWSYLNEKNENIVNHLYDDSFDEVLYPAYEIINLQLWQRLFCEPELTYLVKVGRQDSSSTTTATSATMISTTGPSFNDSIDGVYNGNGSSPLEQQIKQIMQDDLEIDMKLNQHHYNNANTSSSSIPGSGDLMQSSMSSKIANAAKSNGAATQNNKSAKMIRSYDDLSKLTYNSSKFKLEFDSNLDKEYHYTSGSSQAPSNTDVVNNTSHSHTKLKNGSTNEDLNTASVYFNSNGDPIPTRRCSEPNLVLLDALNNASPKLSNNNIIFTYAATAATSIGANPNPTMSTSLGFPASSKTEPIEANSATVENQQEVNAEPNVDTSRQTEQTNSQEVEENHEPVPTTTTTTTTTAPLTNSSLTVQMQNSTDTLVDEALLTRKLMMTAAKMEQLTVSTSTSRQQASGTPSTGGTLSPSERPDSLSLAATTTSAQTGAQQLNVALSSESSTSSTIPSPTASSGAPAPLPDTTPRAVASNSVSTSTSGLFDYVHHSPRFQQINETFKLFNNAHADLLADELNALNEQLQYEATVNGGQSSNNGENGVPMKLNGFNNTTRNNNTCNNNGTMKANGKNRVSSNSIPIKSRNGPNTAQMVAAAKKSRKKTIRDFIDVDGLTKIDDRTFRKIVERDEKYKKEIAMLKEQLSRCKMFFNKLAAYPVWQETPPDFVANDLLDNTQSDENQSNCCYSLSNESFCSSWDEIEEADYKLAAWVPDYYVTHCQSCNDKFTLRLRKHHCRHCGQVFCYKCADNFYPLPNLNLTAPVRVCRSCKSIIERQQQQQGGLKPNGMAISSVNMPTNGINNQQQQRYLNHPTSTSTLLFSSTPPNNGDLNNFNRPKVLMTNGQSPSAAQNTNFISNSCNLQAADPNKFKHVSKSATKSQKVSV